MADDFIQIIKMGDSSAESDERYEIYEAGTDMFCVIDLENNKQTPGKTSGAKPKYKQSYREAWESMRDFKGWLSSVPGNTAKAYCKLCQKELHCHRLSLLKHKVTFKHQMREEEQKLLKIRGNKSEVNLKNTENLFNKEGHEVLAEHDIFNMQEVSSEAEVSDHVLDHSSVKSDSNNLKIEKMCEAESGILSTHVLDTSRGQPGGGVQVILYKLVEGRWTLIGEGLTNIDGRCSFFTGNTNEFSEGRYKLHFDIDKYFEKLNQETIFPFIEVIFDVKIASSKYHIPLLLSPYGYSTYKGS